MTERPRLMRASPRMLKDTKISSENDNPTLI